MVTGYESWTVFRATGDMLQDWLSARCGMPTDGYGTVNIYELFAEAVMDCVLKALIF
jgi:hypothetical protein